MNITSVIGYIVLSVTSCFCIGYCISKKCYESGYCKHTSEDT